jgi:L-malate glycosyltransferase
MHVLVFTAIYTRHASAKGNPPLQQSRPFVQEQVRALSQTHRVTVVTPERVRLSELFERCPPFEVEESWVVYRPRYLHVRGIWWILYFLTSLWCAFKIDWETVDVIHAHQEIPAGFVAAWFSLWYRKPLVLTLHRGEEYASFVAPLVKRLVTQWTIERAQRVVVVSRSLQRQIESVGIKGHFTVVPNIVDTNIFCPLQQTVDDIVGPVHLLWVGGFKPEYYRRKGGRELLRAVAITRPYLPNDIRLTLIGGGAAKVESEALAHNLDIADVCNFVGELSHKQVSDWMQRCDMLVLASHSESFGVVLIEAMACGKPVVATRCGGPEEIVTPETGILVETCDPQALAEGIIRLVDTYDQFDPQQIAAYAHTNFNPERVAGILTQVYEEVCAAET